MEPVPRSAESIWSSCSQLEFWVNAEDEADILDIRFSPDLDYMTEISYDMGSMARISVSRYSPGPLVASLAACMAAMRASLNREDGSPAGNCDTPEEDGDVTTCTTVSNSDVIP